MKNIVMVVILAGAIGGAVYMMMSGDKEVTQAKQQEHATTYMCTECGNVIKLTPYEVSTWMKDPEHTRYAKDQGGRDAVFKCPKCGKYAVVRARKCPVHKELYPVADPVTNVTLDCPKCQAEAAE